MTDHSVEDRGLKITQHVLDRKVSVLEAAQDLIPVLLMIPQVASQDDFDLVRAIESEIDDLPIGRVRELWHIDSLPEKDREIKRLEGLWLDAVLQACKRIQRSLLVRILVLDQHLNVAERQIVGAVSRKEVSAILKSLVLRDGVFPEEAREGFGYEGAFIGRVASGAQLVQQRTDASNPRVVAERRVHQFDNVDAAVEAFIDCEWAKGIDGIPLRITPIEH